MPTRFNLTRNPGIEIPAQITAVGLETSDSHRVHCCGRCSQVPRYYKLTFEFDQPFEDLFGPIPTDPSMWEPDAGLSLHSWKPLFINPIQPESGPLLVLQKGVVQEIAVASRGPLTPEDQLAYNGLLSRTIEQDMCFWKLKLSRYTNPSEEYPGGREVIDYPCHWYLYYCTKWSQNVHDDNNLKSSMDNTADILAGVGGPSFISDPSFANFQIDSWAPTEAKGGPTIGEEEPIQFYKGWILACIHYDRHIDNSITFASIMEYALDVDPSKPEVEDDREQVDIDEDPELVQLLNRPMPFNCMGRNVFTLRSRRINYDPYLAAMPLHKAIIEPFYP